ncbi:MAG: hypothetical protein UE295_10070, partial [Acutalibacteraceae bacterium]|nr:hypothetical protein [Acutalibacteraceae bacterium]
MKKLASILLSSAVVVSMAAISASAEVTELPADWDPTAYEYIVVGNEGILGSYAWDPTNEAFKMNYDEAANLWYLNLEGVANEGEMFDFYNSPQYKVVVYGYSDNPWDFSFNETGVAYGLDSNSPVNFGETAETAEVVTITFDGEKTASYIDNPYVPASDDHTYFAVGNEPLFNPAWDPAAPAYQMTKGADGIFSVKIDVTEEMWDSDVAYKVAQDGSWEVSYNDKGLAEGLNSDAMVYIPEGAVAVVITFNPETLCAGAECVMDGEEPTEAPTAEATEAPTAEATEDATSEATEAPTAEATVAPTTSATDATNSTVAPTNATSSATNATSSNNNTSTNNNTNSSATGKVATGDSTTIALLIGMLMLAGAGVV